MASYSRKTYALFLVLASVITNSLNEQCMAAENALKVSEKLTANDWPWWRGPTRDGQAGTTSLPTKFSATEHVLWQASIPGRGHSSPIVVGNRVFLTTADEKSERQLILAYDLESGNQLWKLPINTGGFPAKNHAKNTEASPTIASDGERIYAAFFHHKHIELTAVQLDGSEAWQKNAGAFDPKMFEYGYAPSPVLYGNSVIIAAEYDGKSFIVAFDRLNGNELWRTDRPSAISFSSPVVAHVAGRDQLLISGQEKVCSYDPTTGQLLWQVNGTTNATCGTAIWNDEVVFASGGYPKAETIAVKADGSGKVVWKNNQKCYEQSMILIDGCIYALTDKGIMYCWRASDGKELWLQRLAGPVSASPIYAGGHLYWANEAGTVYVLKPNPEKFELVAENRLGSEAFASPAVSGKRLLLRVAEGKGEQRQETIYCFSN